jgi:ubiquinone/menaquinone biosynthesis C-methylase UbiE
MSLNIEPKNIDQKVVNDFGKEWADFDQSSLSTDDLLYLFNSYFDIFPWHKLPENAVGFDLGCGSGRWAKFCAPKVGKLHCIDPSAEALNVAKQNLSTLGNCVFHQAGVDEIPLADNSMDFGYCLGVLHHIPDTEAGMKNCVQKLKPNAPFLVYIYYAFDNRPFWFKMIWQVADLVRRFISILPYPLKYFLSQLIALLIYLPLARLAKILEKLGLEVENLPLSSYRNQSFYSMRTDALDRFGTRLEKRFTQQQIREMMTKAGLENIEFNNHFPFWCGVGYRCINS